MGVRCAICHGPLRSAPPESGTAVCQTCGRGNTALVFPALHFNPSAKPPSLPAEPPAEGEAACFYSPNRKATKVCSHCGVLISDIWSAHWGSEVVCLRCLDHLRDTAKDSRFEKGRPLWDNIALATALVPATLIFYWAAFITAPAALFLSIRYWSAPRSLVPRSRLRIATALVLSLLQVGAIIALFVGLWFSMEWIRKL